MEYYSAHKREWNNATTTHPPLPALGATHPEDHRIYLLDSNYHKHGISSMLILPKVYYYRSPSWVPI